MSQRDVMVGTVTEFDERSGLGAVSNGTPFHVIEIADGTRTIEVGQRVAWIPRLKLGKVEASRLIKLNDE